MTQSAKSASRGRPACIGTTSQLLSQVQAIGVTVVAPLPNGATKVTPTIRHVLIHRSLLFLLLSVILNSGRAMADADVRTISLAGTWRFRLDPKNVGIEQQWYATRLPDEINLPGTTDEAKLGLPNPAKPSLDGLYRPNVYTGPAWYQRDIEIPADWQGKRVELFLERVHWETRVWLDGREIGTQDSLIAPQVHDLGTGITPASTADDPRRQQPEVQPGQVRLDPLRRDADELERHRRQVRIAGLRPRSGSIRSGSFPKN